MVINYSASKNMFYDGDLKDAYQAGSGWPDDCIEVSEDVFIKYVNSPPVGKIRTAGTDGLPTWGDIPAPTQQQLLSAAETEKLSRIGQANDYMNSKQWPGKAAVGRLKGDELEQYNLWLNYLDALDAVDTTTAPDITWPVKPDDLAR